MPFYIEYDVKQKMLWKNNKHIVINLKLGKLE